MPIQTSNAVIPHAFIAGLDLEEEVQDFAAANVAFTFEAKVCRLKGASEHGKFVVSIPCTLADASAVAKGTCSTLTRLAIRERVTLAIKGMMSGDLDTAQLLEDAVDQTSESAAQAFLGVTTQTQAQKVAKLVSSAKIVASPMIAEGPVTGALPGKSVWQSMSEKVAKTAAEMQALEGGMFTTGVSKGLLNADFGKAETAALANLPPAGVPKEAFFGALYGKTITDPEMKAKFDQAMVGPYVIGVDHAVGPDHVAVITTGHGCPMTSKPTGALDLLPPLPKKKLVVKVEPAPEPAKPTIAEISQAIEKTAKPCTLDEMRNSQPVKLLHATRLYAPVTASSPGSRYFAVALRADLKIAARYKEQKLSMRAEGEIQEYASALAAAGFEKGGDGYVSVHFAVPTPTLAAKTLGAVLMALDKEWHTPAPKLTAFAGEGA